MTIRNLPQHVFIRPSPTLCIVFHFISMCCTLSGGLTFKNCEYMYLMKIIKYMSLVNLPRYLSFLVLFYSFLQTSYPLSLAWRTFYTIPCSVVCWTWSLSAFVGMGMSLFHTHFWRIILTVYNILGWQIPPHPFGTLNMSFYFCLHCFLTTVICSSHFRSMCAMGSLSWVLFTSAL